MKSIEKIIEKSIFYRLLLILGSILFFNIKERKKPITYTTSKKTKEINIFKKSKLINFIYRK